MFREQGTQLGRSTSYHPRTDRQTKIANKYLETYLRCSCVEKPKLWADLIDWAELWYNTTYHASLNMTPYQA